MRAGDTHHIAHRSDWLRFSCVLIDFNYFPGKSQTNAQIMLANPHSLLHDSSSPTTTQPAARPGLIFVKQIHHDKSVLTKHKVCIMLHRRNLI